jgi:hypothetical protein
MNASEASRFASIFVPALHLFPRLSAIEHDSGCLFRAISTAVGGNAELMGWDLRDG